ncbi:MAG: hypothetical protein K2L51_00800, partial [Clostridiales bacterium]|nr:hypothetical protein [Clostridiales bacterium]
MRTQRSAIFCFLFVLAAMLLFPVLQSAGAQESTPAVTYETAATSAECMAVTECATGRVLFGKNADRKRPMASTTKICT